jgi:hypothetical protein
MHLEVHDGPMERPTELFVHRQFHPQATLCFQSTQQPPGRLGESVSHVCSSARPELDDLADEKRLELLLEAACIVLSAVRNTF